MGERVAGMARQLRIEYRGAICHVMARGERIAHEESDRYTLIETLGEACVKTGRLMHAWDIDGQFAAGGMTRVRRSTASNEKCGECQPAVGTGAEVGKSQPEIGAETSSLSRIVD
jgi:hypothetical protein